MVVLPSHEMGKNDAREQENQDWFWIFKFEILIRI